MSAPDDGDGPRRPRPVRRDEGEVTNWPRGLAGYVPRPEAPDQGPPGAEEDRVAQRIVLACRLTALARSAGRDDPGWDEEIRRAREAYARGDRKEARARTEAVLARLGTSDPRQA
ncbi:MAG: hypothetical protein QXG65_02680 [Thermoplasmata archaeon]